MISRYKNRCFPCFPVPTEDHWGPSEEPGKRGMRISQLHSIPSMAAGFCAIGKKLLVISSNPYFWNEFKSTYLTLKHTLRKEKNNVEETVILSNLDIFHVFMCAGSVQSKCTGMWFYMSVSHAVPLPMGKELMKNNTQIQLFFLSFGGKER